MIIKFATTLAMTAALLVSVNVLAADSDMSPTTSTNPASSTTYGDTTTTTTPATTSTTTMPTTSTTPSTTTTGTDTMSLKAAKGVGIFTKTSGQNCDPTCEGTLAMNGQSGQNALLFLKDDKNALIFAPYTAQDSMTLKQLLTQKNVMRGTWKKNDDGTIEFKSYSGKSRR